MEDRKLIARLTEWIIRNFLTFRQFTTSDSSFLHYFSFRKWKVMENRLLNSMHNAKCVVRDGNIRLEKCSPEMQVLLTQSDLCEKVL